MGELTLRQEVIDSLCPNKDLLVLSPLAVLVAVDYSNSKTRGSESLHQPAAIGATVPKEVHLLS